MPSWHFSTSTKAALLLGKLLFLFIVVPLVELALLLWLADLTDWRWTLGLVVLTGIVGSFLARAQGFRTVRRIQEQLGSGKMPTDALLDGLLILISGALLVTPGILTDAFGFSLLIPPCRALYRRWLVRRFKSGFRVETFRMDGTPTEGDPANDAPPDATPQDPVPPEALERPDRPEGR